MNYRVVVKQLANRDLQVALEYYANIRENLKDSLLDEVRKTFLLLEENPLRRAPNAKGIRQFALNRFPYVVNYLIESNQVFVIAVLHERRRPQLRKERFE